MVFALQSNGQWSWGINFENNSWSSVFEERIVRDTLSNPNCKWQIGKPRKTVFDSAYQSSRALVTDTANPLPPNDTSVFILKHARDNANPFHIFTMNFVYKMDGDSNDFGTIEISPDTGHTWINVLTEDTLYDMRYHFARPTLSGSTNGWKHFWLDMAQWASADPQFTSYPVYLTADTILFRFTYITDSDTTPRDGWMIDNIEFGDWWEGVEQIRYDALVTVYPNPAANNLFISTDTGLPKNTSVQIFDLNGKKVFEKKPFTAPSINIAHLPNGFYTLRYETVDGFAAKRFVVRHDR